MNKIAQKLKDLVKGKKESFGTDPRDPWSVKSNIAEDGSLNDYLKAKGINPQFVSKETKISHAKSSAFLKWKQDHQFEEVEYVTESSLLNQYLESKGLNPMYVPKDKKIAYAKSAEFIKWKQQHMHEETKLEEAKSKPTALERWRSAASQREKEAEHRRKEMEARHDAGKEDMKGSIERLSKALNKEESELEEQASKSQIDKFHKKLDKLVHSSFGKSSDEKKMKEDVGDPKSATQSPADGANGGNELAERKRQMSKSARIIKSLYKKKGVVKEDLYDHEKEDKSVATYGKKPKLDVADKKESIGEKKPQAAAVLSGGKTMTGTERDTIELDPMMRNRPNQPDVTKKDDKDKKEKDDKKKDK